MGFLGDLTPTGPWGMSTLLKAAGVAMGALTVLYILKLRLRTVEVPFSKLWSRVLKDRQASALWRYLKRILSFLIQALLIFFLVAAVADPRSRSEIRKGRQILVLLDTSASMKALDGDVPGRGKGPFNRLDEAKNKLKRFLATKRRRDRVMIVRMDSQVTPVTAWEEDLEALRRAVDKIKASDAPADVARALRFAVDTLKPMRDPQLVLVTDGGFDSETLGTVYWGDRMPRDLVGKETAAEPRPAPRPEARPDKEKEDKEKEAKDDKGRGRRRRGREKEPERPVKKKAPKPAPLGGGEFLDPIGMGRIPVFALLVGRSTNNIGIVSFNARRHLADKLNYEVFVQVKNFRKTPSTFRLQLFSGGVLPDTALMKLNPGETRSFIKRELPAAGASLSVRILPETSKKGRLDDFPLDDSAYALIPQRPPTKVLLVSPGNLYLEGALLLDENTTYDRITHDKYKAAATEKYDAVIFDDYNGEPLPKKGNVLIFNPDPTKSPIPVVRQVLNPPIFWPSEPKHRRHAVMKFVTIKDVNTVRASVFDLEKGDAPLMMTDERGPVFAAVRRKEGLKLVVVGFSVRQTDWVIRVSFPIFVLDSLNWFAGIDPRLIKSHRTGRTWQIPIDVADEHVEAEDPERRRFLVPVQKGNAMIYGRHVGYYTLFAGRRRIKVAGNLANEKESNIAVPEKLWLGGSKYGRKIDPPTLAASARDTKPISPSTWVLIALLLAVGLGLLIAGLLTGATGPVWVLAGLVVLSLTTAALFYIQDFYLWTCLLTAVMVVLLVEWLTYNRRVTV